MRTKGMFAVLVIICAMLLAGCGDDVPEAPQPPPPPAPAPDAPQTPGNPPPDESPPPELPDQEQNPPPAGSPPYTATLQSDSTISTGNTAVVFNSDWIIGNLSSLPLSDPNSPSLARVITDGSDAVVRSFGGRIYVVNRLGTDTIQVINPSDFSVIANFSVGRGSNPQDIAVISDDKAYVSRLDSQNDASDTGDVLVFNPLTGRKLGSIDLKPYTDPNGDRLARAAQMVLVGKKLYVCMQDLPANLILPANTNGKIAIIDTETDAIVDADPNAAGTQVIGLAGRNPSDITYSPLTERLYIADTGVYVNFVVDTSDGNGGIEAVRPSDNTSEGIVIDDAALGGGVAEVRIYSATLGFTITSSMSIASFNPTAHAVLSTNVYTTPGFYLPDFTIDAQGRLFIAEQDMNGPGVVIINATDGARVAGPIGVGAPPVSIAFVDVK